HIECVLDQLVAPAAGVSVVQEHLQVVGGRKSTEDAAAFGDVGDTQLFDAMRLGAGDRLAIERDAASARRDGPGDRPGQAALAGAVRAKYGHAVSRRQGEGHAEQRFGQPVPDVYVFYLK